MQASAVTTAHVKRMIFPTKYRGERNHAAGGSSIVTAPQRAKSWGVSRLLAGPPEPPSGQRHATVYPSGCDESGGNASLCQICDGGFAECLQKRPQEQGRPLAAVTERIGP